MTKSVNVTVKNYAHKKYRKQFVQKFKHWGKWTSSDNDVSGTFTFGGNTIPTQDAYQWLLKEWSSDKFGK